MMAAPGRRVCLACSIFRDELERLRAEGRTAFTTAYLGSQLHMVPERLQELVRERVRAELGLGNEVLLCYGDCCPGMVDLQDEPGVERTQGINCCEILLGSERYRALRREGAFFLMPEWAHCWRRIFQDTLGLEGETARTFMREMHTKLIYLDTGLVPVPERELGEIAEYAGLPVERLAVTLEPLLENLREASARMGHGQA